jgi:carbon storage regulator
MLVLSRKQNERIRVGDSVVVTIVRVSGDKVRIGIEAPPDVRVLRDELRPSDTLQVEAVDGDVCLGNLVIAAEHADCHPVRLAAAG